MTVEEKREYLDKHCTGKHCVMCIIHAKIPDHRCGRGTDFLSETKGSYTMSDDEINAAYEVVCQGESPLDRVKYIEALEEVCKDCNGCENCPIGKIEHNRNYCRGRDWADMDDYGLKTLAKCAGIVFDEDEKVEEDPVNHPNHYTSGGVECIDAIKASMTPIEYAGFLKGQVLKYVWRYRLKGKPVQDLKKARFYLDRLIQLTEKEEVTA